MKTERLKRSLSLTGITLVATIFCSGCGGTWDPKSTSDLQTEFANEFGLSPSSDITNISCRVVNVGDSSLRWISFECSTNTFEELVRQRFDSIERRDFDAPSTGERGSVELVDPYDRNVNAPSWWPDIKGIQFERLYYKLKKVDGQSGYVFLILDPVGNRIYVRSKVWR